jgi:hypothetical protein
LVDDREHAFLRDRTGDRPAEIVDRGGTEDGNSLRREIGSDARHVGQSGQTLPGLEDRRE